MKVHPGKLRSAIGNFDGDPRSKAFIHRTSGEIVFCYGDPHATKYPGVSRPPKASFLGRRVPLRPQKLLNDHEIRMALDANPQDWIEIPKLHGDGPTIEAKMAAFVKFVNPDFILDW